MDTEYLRRQYQKQLEKGYRLMNAGDPMGAALEAYAITHSMYAPNDIKVRAHHLHSGCTEDYVIALERLMSAADILAAMDQEDEDVKFLKDAQKKMEADVQKLLDAQREARERLNEQREAQERQRQAGNGA